MGLNGGPLFQFTEAVSFCIYCDDQAEVDRLWDKLTADGGAPSQCGWLKDKFGLSWQIVPKALAELMGSGDADVSRRVMQAMMTMKKIDIAALRQAAAGAKAA
jgi:predicted 3-demethylubiquinone-9 3-methyltransferase (glyoxalase superfamily)